MKIYLNKETGVFALSCCGEISDPAYTLLKANDSDAALEKHVPVVKVANGCVCVDVGAVPHPMTEPHYITALILETSSGYQFKRLAPTDAPKGEFRLAEGEKPIAVYEYCNLHGLWVTNL